MSSFFVALLSVIVTLFIAMIGTFVITFIFALGVALIFGIKLLIRIPVGLSIVVGAICLYELIKTAFKKM